MFRQGGTLRAGLIRASRGDLLSRTRSVSPENSNAAVPAPLLVLAQASAETDELLEPLVERPDLILLRVANLDAAELALRDVAIQLVIVCPETAPELVTALVETADRIRPKTPVLVLRFRSGATLSAWKGRGIGVLRAPILPDVLSRSVDVALGLTSVQEIARGKARHG